MKKFLFFLIISISIGEAILTSCNTGGKPTPEEEVRNYGKYFVEKLNANQLDSLAVSYPDIAKADSIIPITSDTIIVAENAPGQFDMTLADGITLKVTRSEDGNISVIESKGLFAFPADKVDIAKKTGMWDDNLSDAGLNERMKDEEFYKWLNNKKTIKTSDIIELGNRSSDISSGTGFRDVINKTDHKIKGSDYQVIRTWIDIDPNCGDWIETKGSEVLSGKDIPPHGRVKFEYYFGNHLVQDIKSIKLKLTPEQIQEKFAPHTGNEYQEYLNSKK